MPDSRDSGPLDPGKRGVGPSLRRVMLLALFYGLAFAFGRWALDALFGVDPITYVSLGIAAFFGFATGGLVCRGC